MSFGEVLIQKDANYIRDYHAPKLVVIMGWSAAIQHDVIHLYDPLGDLAATLVENQATVLHKTELEHVEAFLRGARKKLTPAV